MSKNKKTSNRYSTTLVDLINDPKCPLESGSILCFKITKNSDTRYWITLNANGTLKWGSAFHGEEELVFKTISELCKHIVKTRTNRKNPNTNGWVHTTFQSGRLKTLWQYRKEHDDRIIKDVLENIVKSVGRCRIKNTGVGAASIPFEGNHITFSDDEEEDNKVTQEYHDKWRCEGGYKWKKSGYRLFSTAKNCDYKYKVKEYTTNRKNKTTIFRWVDEWIQHEAEKGSQGHSGIIGYKNKPSNKDGFIILRRVYERPIQPTLVPWREV
jgi:hypothetical protein